MDDERARRWREWMTSALALLGTAGLGACFVHASCANGNAVHMLIGHVAAPVLATLALLVPSALLVRLFSKRFAAQG